MIIMRNINNRYLIENEINNEENYCKYIVKEYETDNRYIFSILKNDFTYEKTREYLLSKFKTIKSFNCSNVVNLINIEIIHNMDGIKLDKYQYGYLMEYVDNYINVQSYMKSCALEEKLDIFMELCAIINTLNTKGYIFEDITYKDMILFLDKKDKRVHVKINNILQNEINKVTLINISKKELPYPYNIENNDESVNVKDNINEVLKFFYKIFTDDELENVSFGLKDIKKKFDQNHIINKKYNLYDFIQYINDKLNKNYIFFLDNILNVLEEDIDIIRRDEEIKIIDKNYKNILDGKIKYKIISFNGDDGSGKTRLLNEIKYMLENKYFVTDLYIDEFIGNSNYETLRNIIEYIEKVCDKQIYEKYEIYIKKFIDICIENKEDSISKIEKNQQLQLMNRVGKFMREYTSSNILIYIVDDLDKKPDILKKFIRYMACFEKELENLMIIFSFNESSCDDSFLKYIHEFKEVDEYEEYKIDLFNQYDTTKMIKNILNTNRNIESLSSKIYSETLGNPQYIKEVIKELYNNNILYFNKDSGEWTTSVDVKDIKIPKTLEEKLEISMASLNDDEIMILRMLSIYETPLPEIMILEDIITEPYNIHIYEELKHKGYLIDKISDQGMLVGFSNNLLRNILCLKLDSDEKRIMHKKAAALLKQTLYETDYYTEEFLFHLEECGEFDILSIYALEYARNLELHDKYEKAVFYYDKVLKYSKNNFIKAAIYAAKIYERLSDHKKSFEYFNKAREYAIKENDIETKVYTMIEMVIIQINSSIYITPQLENCLKNIRKDLDNMNAPLEEAYYNYALLLKYRTQFKFELAVNSAQKAIEICKKNNIKEDIYGWILLVLGTIYHKIFKFEKAEKLFSEALNIFLDNKNNNGIIGCKLLKTCIDFEKGYPIEVILDSYYRIEKLSRKIKLYKRLICTLIYIAKLYIDEKQYEKAEEELIKALNIEREENIDYYSVELCTNLCIVYLGLGKLRLAIKYYSLIQQMKKTIQLVDDDIVDIYKTEALYNIFIFNNIEAYKNIDKIDKGSVSYYNKNTICMYYQLMLYICNNDEDIKKTYNEFLIKLNSIQNQKVKLEMKISAVKSILDLGYYDIAKELFYEIKEYPKDFNTEGVYIYLEFKFRNRNTYNFLINKALRLCTVITDKKVCADLYNVVAEKYEELRCYILAINNFCESILIHLNIINILNEQDKITYVNNGPFLNIRRSLIKCLKEKIGFDEKYTDVDKIDNLEQLESIIDEISVKNILKNKNIYKLMQDTYEKCYYNDLRDSYKLFSTFSNNIVKDIESLMKYMARITLADKAVFAVENNRGKNNVICTYRVNDKNEIDRYFSLKFDSEDDVVLIENSENTLNQLDNEILTDEIKSYMYVKVRNRERHINVENSISGQLILLSTKAMNYINCDSKKKIEEVKPFLTFLLEQYNLTITSTLDKLTSVYNRKYLDEALLFLLDSSQIDKSEFAVIMFDIDDFKGVNDKYGHQIGDEVLIKLTREVENTIGKNDIIGRYGGEEFIVLVSDADKNKACIMAEKIRSNVEKAKILGDKRKITISIGVAMSNHERMNSEEIVNRADQALYRAKHEGKNRYVLWSEETGLVTATNTNTELSGVLTGNTAKDLNFMSIIKEVSLIVKSKESKEKKMYNFILKIMQIIECENIALFIIKNGMIINILNKDRSKDGWNKNEKFNFQLVYRVIAQMKGIYQIDWNNIKVKKDKFGIPDWKSICITPVICNGVILAIIYASVSVNKKEFTSIELNQLNFFADMGIPIFE